MTARRPGERGPTAYRIRVEKHLDQHWAEWFGRLVLTRQDDGTTTLTGVVADQAELHGLLAKIRDLGLTLISVAVVDPATDSTRSAAGRADAPPDLRRTPCPDHPSQPSTASLLLPGSPVPPCCW